MNFKSIITSILALIIVLGLSFYGYKTIYSLENFVARNGLPDEIEKFDDKLIIVYEHTFSPIIVDNDSYLKFCGIEYNVVNNTVLNPFNNQTSCKQYKSYADNSIADYTYRTMLGSKIKRELKKSLKNK